MKWYLGEAVPPFLAGTMLLFVLDRTGALVWVVRGLEPIVVGMFDLPRDMATELAAQTVLGAGAMVVETAEHPAKLKDMVTTPAGCTIDGILELEEGGLRVTLIKAVVKATQRAKELVEG